MKKQSKTQLGCYSPVKGREVKMEFELAKAIVQGYQLNEFGNAPSIDEECEDEDEDEDQEEENEGSITLYRDYSGRGMYGAKTFGIVFNSFTELLAAIATAARENPDLQFDYHTIRQDSLGYSTILY